MVSADWRKTNKTLKILRAAEDGKYGIVAGVAYNLEQVLGMISAAESKRSPLIVQFFPWAITFSRGLLVKAAAQAAAESSVPVSIHLDHAQDEDLIKHAADNLPFDSIMIDLSRYSKVENLEKTRVLVQYCNERGIATEAEPGRIEGGEDGISDTADLEGMLTTPEEALEFVETGIDMLAPAFGNIHGEYGSRGIQLEFDRLDKIRKAVDARVHLVLHGTNSFPEDIMKQCVKAGITKVNVNKLVLDDYLVYVKENAHKVALTKLMEDGVQEVKRLVEWQCDVCGSTGKA